MDRGNCKRKAEGTAQTQKGKEMKIDIAMIDGYEGMSDAEKIEALTNFEFADANEVENKYKKLISERNTEVANYKKQNQKLDAELKARMDEAELKQREKDEELTKLKEEYEVTIRENKVAKQKAHYKALGYSDELASDTAEAFVSGDFEKVNANQVKAHEEFEKSIRAEIIRSDPKPTSKGSGTSTVSKADILAIKDTVERQKAMLAHKELFI